MGVLAVALFAGAVVALEAVWPGVGPDYFFHYRAAPADFFAGQTALYDGNTVRYRLLPWSVFLLGPTLLLPVTYGQAVVSVLSLIGITWLTLTVVNEPCEASLPLWGLLLSVVTLHTVDLLVRGNYEGFLALGIALAWFAYKRDNPLLVGVGIAIFVTKPINMVLVGVFFAVASLRKGWRFAALAAAPTLVCLLVSFVLFGPDWMARYVGYATGADQFYNDVPDLNDALYLQTSLWRFFQDVGLSPVWGYTASGVGLAATAVFIVMAKSTRASLALVLAASLFFSFYILGNHYVLLAPVLALLITYDRRFALLWLLTLTPLLRLSWGFNYVWLDNGYALALLLGMVYSVFRQRDGLLTRPLAARKRHRRDVKS